MAFSESKLRKNMLDRPLSLQLLWVLSFREPWTDGEPNLSKLAYITGRKLSTVSESMSFLLKNKLVESTKIGREKLYKVSKNPLVQHFAEAYIEYSSYTETLEKAKNHWKAFNKLVLDK